MMSYSGGTVVQSGVLNANHTHALGTGNVTVNGGATLGGFATIEGDLTLGPDARLSIDLGNIMTVNGSMSFTDLTFDDILGWNAASADVGVYTLINGGTSVVFMGNTNTINNMFDFGNGKFGYFQAGSLQAVITAIPEPTSLVLACLASLSFVFRRRQKVYFS